MLIAVLSIPQGTRNNSLLLLYVMYLRPFSFPLHQLTFDNIFPAVSSTMSDTADQLASKETQYVPNSDMSSPPPPYSYPEQQLPPYSAAPPMYPPPKTETTSICQPGTGYESFADINPETPTETTAVTTSSSFDDKTVRRGFVRKVGALLTHLLLQIICIYSVIYDICLV